MITKFSLFSSLKCLAYFFPELEYHTPVSKITRYILMLIFVIMSNHLIFRYATYIRSLLSVPCNFPEERSLFKAISFILMKFSKNGVLCYKWWYGVLCYVGIEAGYFFF